MRISRSAILITVAILPIFAYGTCFRSWCLYRHSKIRAAGGLVQICSGNEGETRPATFDDPAAGSYSVFLGHGNVNDANIAMLDCYHTFFILDLSNTNVTQAGLDSLPNLRAYVLRLRGVRLGDTDGRFLKDPMNVLMLAHSTSLRRG